MEIHVVQSGESLWMIANRYGVSVASIMEQNELPSANIVPNQSILVPTNYASYVVMPGETLGAIANRYGITVNSILALNPQISAASIDAGDVLRFSLQPTSSITSLGFMELTIPNNDRINVLNNAPYSTYIAPFGYGMDETGSIVPPNDEVALEAIGQTRAIAAAVFSNWTGDNFSKSALHAMLSNPSLRNQYIAEAVRIVRSKGYSGIVIDFESIAPEDSDAFAAFLRELSAMLLPSFTRLFVSVMPITGLRDASNPLLRPYRYAIVAEHAVHLILMAYNWHWATGSPGPVASIQNVERTIQYALSVAPREQLILGMIRYGYDWALPYQENESAAVVSANEAMTMAMQNQSAVVFDTTSMTPSFRYWDSQDREHIVWFEDARSVQAKLQLVRKYRLPGIAQWELSQSFPQFMPLLLNNFEIV